MTERGYERAIVSRLALTHPELAPALRREIAGAIADRALAWGLDPWLVYADIHVESGFRLRAVGQAGEIGLMQVLPSTARMVARRVLGLADFPAARLYDPAWNVRLGTAYLGLMMEQHRGDLAVALAAYNAGTAVEGPTAYTYRVLGVFRRVAMARRVASPPAQRPRHGAVQRGDARGGGAPTCGVRSPGRRVAIRGRDTAGSRGICVKGSRRPAEPSGDAARVV